MAGKDLLKQVFINLISNALKFTPSKGRIDITISSDRKSIKVSVRDTGEGISEEHIRKLFNKFMQVDSSMTRAHGGTGLGLVIVKHILELHKGDISVQSEPGKGSTFTFTVPIKPDAALQEEHEGRKASGEALLHPQQDAES